MERNESANEGGSSPDTVIARSSEEEERRRQTCSTSGEYVTVGDSSSSLDTLTSGGGGGGGGVGSGFPGGLGVGVGGSGVGSGLEGGSGRSSGSGGAGGDASAAVTAGGSASSGARGAAPTAPSPDSSLGSEEKKRGGRFGALKSSFRKEGGLFKMKKKSRAADADNTHEPDQDPDEKEPARKKGHSEEEEAAVAGTGTGTVVAVAEEERNRGGAEGAVSSVGSVKKKKKTRTQSLVRKFSLNKFRLTSGEQESRHTPEGGDSSRSQSQSPQDSPRLSESPTRIGRKGQSSSQVPIQQAEPPPQPHQQPQPAKQRQKEVKERRKLAACTESESEAEEREREKGGGPRKSQKLLERPVSTITVVQRRSPSLTIRSYSRNVEHTLTDNTGQEEREAASERSNRSEVKCSSTLPYAISKWASQQSEYPRATSNSDTGKKVKLSVKAESESESSRASSGSNKSSPVEVRRKLSLLEEKRAIFQRRLFETTRDTASDSHETVIAVSVDDEAKRAGGPSETSAGANSARETFRKKARQISVRKFDTFSTFEGTFDEETGVGYLAGIEEDYTESYDRQNEEYPTMGPMGPGTATGESADRSKVLSQESTSSQNNAPSGGVVGEKREHLYKILVIGELGAGKTSIIKRYVHQFFSQHYRATIGVDFALKVLNWDPHTIIRLQLWDIAGQERFGNMTRVYYKEAVGAFIVFDVTRSATLDAVVKWKQDLDSKVQLPDGTAIPCVLLANKCDQQKEGLVNSPAKMDEYCREKNFAGWFETSAKENINIEEAARFLVNKILQNDQLMKGNGSQDQTDGERFALNQSPTSSKKGCSC